MSEMNLSDTSLAESKTELTNLAIFFFFFLLASVQPEFIGCIFSLQRSSSCLFSSPDELLKKFPGFDFLNFDLSYVIVLPEQMTNW